MRTPPDLHPDDPEIRLSLRDMLVDTRRAHGMSQRDLGLRLGKAATTITLMEANPMWRISTVQHWAAALGQRLVLHPDCLPPDEEVYLLRPADPESALAFDRRMFVLALRDARRWMGITQRRLGERLGISENGVAEIEKGHDVLLVTAQRYCRAVGASLLVELEEEAAL